MGGFGHHLKGLADDEVIDALSFERIYRDSRNRPQTQYHLPRREVEILLTGYSIPLRAKVIDRLHELEEEAKGRAVFRVPQSLP